MSPDRVEKSERYRRSRRLGVGPTWIYVPLPSMSPVQPTSGDEVVTPGPAPEAACTTVTTVTSNNKEI